MSEPTVPVELRPTIPVQLLMRPLVSVGMNVVSGAPRFAVNCKICGPNVQVTGEGGYEDADDARKFAQQHRRDHLEALKYEITRVDLDDNPGPERTVVVVCWVYWNGDEQGGGGFNWWEESFRDLAEQAFAAEGPGWGDTPVGVRLLDMRIPASLTDPAQVTEWLDDRMDELEFDAPATKSWPTPEHDCGMCDSPIVFDGVDEAGNRLWRCSNCDWTHTSKDCCQNNHVISEEPA